MKKFIVTLVLCLISFWCYEFPITKNFAPVIVHKTADFMSAFCFLKKHEGFYSNDSSDYGGETYCGITRKWNPSWRGWKFIDQAKPLRQNDSVPGMAAHYVLDYYLTIWVRENFYELENQQVANYLFDFRNNGSISTRIVTRILVEMGSQISVVDGEMNAQIISEINKIDSQIFLKKLSLRREIFYQNIVRKDSTQLKFLSHWLHRARHV